jgi:hypothetical protein
MAFIWALRMNGEIPALAFGRESSSDLIGLATEPGATMMPQIAESLAEFPGIPARSTPIVVASGLTADCSPPSHGTESQQVILLLPTD